MRKKSAKSKNEEKTHKHSRRRRKSSSSESEGETAEVQEQPAEEPVEEPVEEPKTRRSKKTVDKVESKEVENNAAAGGRITRHSRRLAAISAVGDEQKESTPEMLSPAKTGKSSPYSSDSSAKDGRRKDGTPDKHKPKDTWTVESANGSGFQKLKIRLQRFPETSASSEEAEGEGEIQQIENNDSRESTGETVEKTADEEAVEEVIVSMADISENDVADIELPSEGRTEIVADAQSPRKTRSDSPEQVVEEVVGVENIELPPEPEPQPVINDVQTSETTTAESRETPEETLSEIKLPEEIPLPIESTDVDKIADKGVEVVETCSKVVENVEPAPVTLARSEIVSSPQQALSEQEDKDSQAELVLTVEDNVMEEQSSSATGNEENDGTSTAEKDSVASKKKSLLTSIPQVEMEEVYDYEHDDTREEGELSANEAMSPIHEVFKKLPAEERKRSWGACTVFHFNRNKIVASEQILKERNIVKRVINKDDLESSESEDLIFVKEIREENIVHDIESETGNNTSFTEKEFEEEKEDESTATRKRHTLESDKIVDKSSKRRSKESKTVSGEGKTVLYITNLVRPFTVTQLRELLQRTGRIVENGFWIDSIKSKCYVQFENSDQAIETRHALHGIRWPVNNPKVLSVHFATPEELSAAQAQLHESEAQRREPLAVSNHNNDTSQKHIDWKKHFEQYDERPRKIKDVREWDIGKPAHPDEMMWMDDEFNKKKEDAEPTGRSRRERDRDRDRERDRDRDRDRDRKRRNEFSDEDARTKRHRKAPNDTQPPAEAKLLDDLFRRTKASPSIYWLPLSAEQIAVKQEARRKHLEEISKQMKDRSGDREPRRRDRERRRSRR